MALTKYQIGILRLLAERRMREGISYVAGGTALNLLIESTRKSLDIDIFHDTSEALLHSWEADKKELLTNGYSVKVMREYPSFIEADVQVDQNTILIQWCRDSAFRFFPLIENPVLGLTLHPFDLATNKILAMSGRLEPRDWIDAIECNRLIQQLGFLVWAATGKDPGVNPTMLLEDASRLHYSQAEINILDFESNPPVVSHLSREWKEVIVQGKKIIDILPEEQLGKCILDKQGKLYGEELHSLCDDLKKGDVFFHEGSIGGAWPEIVQRNK